MCVDCRWNDYQLDEAVLAWPGMLFVVTIPWTRTREELKAPIITFKSDDEVGDGMKLGVLTSELLDGDGPFNKHGKRGIWAEPGGCHPDEAA